MSYAVFNSFSDSSFKFHELCIQVNYNCANNSMLDSFGLFAAFRHGQTFCNETLEYY
jgi:hypothetical protein